MFKKLFENGLKRWLKTLHKHYFDLSFRKKQKKKENETDDVTGYGKILNYKGNQLYKKIK